MSLSPTRQQIHDLVCSSPKPLDTDEIALSVGRTRSTVNSHLRALLELGLVRRRNEPCAYANNRFVYFRDGADSVVGSGSKRRPPSSDPVDRAIERTRPNWRKGETFSRENVAEFRREHEARQRRWFGH